MGGYSAFSGSEVQNIATAGAIGVADATTRPRPGGAIGMNNGTGLELHRSFYETTATHVVNTHMSFSFTPTLGDPTYGAQTYYLTALNAQSFEFYTQGENENDTWVPTGMQGNLGFNLAIGEPVTWTSEMVGPMWTSGAADVLGIGAVTNPTPQVFKAEQGAEVRLYQAPTASGPDQGAAYSCISVNSLELTPNIVWIDVPSEKGVEGVLQKKRDDQPPVCTLSLTLYYEGAASDAYWDQRDAQTIYGVEVQIGNTPGNTTLISFPRCQITEVQRVGAGELAGVQLDLACLIDELADEDAALADGSAAKLQAISAFSIHRA